MPKISAGFLGEISGKFPFRPQNESFFNPWNYKENTILSDLKYIRFFSLFFELIVPYSGIKSLYFLGTNSI